MKKGGSEMDKKYLERSQTGDAEAFNLLVEPYIQKAYHYRGQ